MGGYIWNVGFFLSVYSEPAFLQRPQIHRQAVRELATADRRRGCIRGEARRSVQRERTDR